MEPAPAYGGAPFIVEKPTLVQFLKQARVILKIFAIVRKIFGHFFVHLS